MRPFINLSNATSEIITDDDGDRVVCTPFNILKGCRIRSAGAGKDKIMITNYTNRKTLAEKTFGNFSTGEMVELWNEYCESPEGDPDNQIFEMDLFNEFMCNLKPFDIAKRIHFGKFSPMDDYFYFDGYANLRSGNFANYLLDRWGTDLPIYPEEMIEWYIAEKE